MSLPSRTAMANLSEDVMFVIPLGQKEELKKITNKFQLFVVFSFILFTSSTIMSGLFICCKISALFFKSSKRFGAKVARLVLKIHHRNCVKLAHANMNIL
jgi:hypothetical protein